MSVFRPASRAEILRICTFAVVAAAGAAMVTALAMEARQADSVWVLGAFSVRDEQKLREYQAVAQPLAKSSGGYVPMAVGPPRLIEGELPAQGLFFVERFEDEASLNQFLDLFESSGRRALRDAAADVHFLLAIPAYH